MPAARFGRIEDEILAAFASRGASPEECWLCADMPIYRDGDGQARALFLGDRVLESACVDHLKRIGRPEVQLKG